MYDDKTMQEAIVAAADVPLTVELDLMDALTITTALAAAVSPEQVREPIWSSGAGLAIRRAIALAVAPVAKRADAEPDAEWAPALQVLMGMLADDDRRFLNTDVLRQTTGAQRIAPLPRGRRRRAG